MRRATGVQEEWSSRLWFLTQAIQNPAYRPADLSKGARRKTAGPSPILLRISGKIRGFGNKSKNRHPKPHAITLRHLPRGMVSPTARLALFGNPRGTRPGVGAREKPLRIGILRPDTIWIVLREHGYRTA